MLIFYVQLIADYDYCLYNLIYINYELVRNTLLNLIEHLRDYYTDITRQIFALCR